MHHHVLAQVLSVLDILPDLLDSLVKLVAQVLILVVSTLDTLSEALVKLMSQSHIVLLHALRHLLEALDYLFLACSDPLLHLQREVLHAGEPCVDQIFALPPMNVLSYHGLRQDVEYLFDYKRYVIPGCLPKQLDQWVLVNILPDVVIIFVFLLKISS